MFRMRFGFIAGLTIGYYLGAMAGRERYEQLNRVIRKVKRADATHVVADKAKSAAGGGFDKAKDGISHRLHHNGQADSQSFSPS